MQKCAQNWLLYYLSLQVEAQSHNIQSILTIFIAKIMFLSNISMIIILYYYYDLGHIWAEMVYVLTEQQKSDAQGLIMNVLPYYLFLWAFEAQAEIQRIHAVSNIVTGWYNNMLGWMCFRVKGEYEKVNSPSPTFEMCQITSSPV